MARHHALVDRELTDIATGRNDRLIVAEPPRHGKTQHIGEYFPPWFMGLRPEANVMYCGPTDSMADSKSRACRDITAKHSRHYFGRGLDPKVQATSRWKLAGTGPDQGEFIAAGIGSGRIMGSGADLLIIDDQFRNVEDALSETIREKHKQWYLTTSKTRLMPGAAIVMICTRWHVDDLIGFVLKHRKATGEKWRVISLPAICEEPEDDPLGRAAGDALWPEMWPLEDLKKTRDGYAMTGYPWMWEALYQQRPPRVLDCEWPAEYFGDHIWFDGDPPATIDCRALALDPSLGHTELADYSAYVQSNHATDGNYYIDADIQRRPTSRIVEDGVRHVRDWKPLGFGCETNGFQELLKDQFADSFESQQVDVNLYGIDNSIKKVTRIRSLSNLLATGKLKFRRNSPGCNLLVEQLMGFPSHKYDDGPDALEMAIRLCDELMGEAAMVMAGR